MSTVYVLVEALRRLGVAGTEGRIPGEGDPVAAAENRSPGAHHGPEDLDPLFPAKWTGEYRQFRPCFKACRKKMSAVGFETVRYSVVYESRVGNAGPLTVLAFDTPLSVVTNELHFVSCPPPLVDLAGKSNPKCVFRT